MSNPYLRPGEHWDPYSRTWKKNLTEAEVQNLWPYAKKEAHKVEPIDHWMEEALREIPPMSQLDTLTEVPDRSGPVPALVDMEMALDPKSVPSRPPTSAEAQAVLLNVMSTVNNEREMMAAIQGIPVDNVVLPKHYARFKIEPIRFCIENDLNGFQFNIIKYVLRHDAKNGLEDLRKARRYLDMFIKFVEGDEDWWR